MILIDANLLIYAVNENSPHHVKAKRWLESVVSGSETVGLPWPVLLAFIRLTTKPGLFIRPLPLSSATEMVANWLRQNAVVVIHPVRDIWTC